MKFSATLFLLLLCNLCVLADIPSGDAQLETPPELILGGTDEQGRDFFYLAQPAVNGKLILTASNGFFTKRTATAKGTSKLPKKGDEDLIAPNFEYLDWKNAEGTLRWHILTTSPGKVHFAIHLDANDPGTKVIAEFAGQTRELTTSRSTPIDLSYDTKPGEHRFSLRAANPGSGSVGKLHHIDVFGPAADNASLLRVRWRPAAAHGSYDTEKVKNAKLLVFTTRSTCEVSSYSPITTPFGYYGTSFDKDRRSNGSFNFSMWGNEKASTDLKTMPHLLAVGSPEGEFSGFGHEGSGVKPRGWTPMPDRPELVVQALRIVNGENYDTYFGYYFDHPTDEWKLYGAGNKWHGGKPGEHLKLGSFCEVPGPPQSERTGDIAREVRRKAWAYDDGKWVPLEIYSPGGSGSKGDIAVNKSWYTSSDGEYVMGCGGIRLYKHNDSYIKPSSSPEYPYFLISPSVENLFRMPVTYRKIQTTEIGSDSAKIEVDLASTSDLREAALYYGTKDALTFAPRELHGTEKKSELSNAINEMTWQSEVKFDSVANGVNRVSLNNLKPDTTYFYRILTTNETSQVWNDETHTFTTTSSGARPVTLPGLQSSGSEMEKEPFRNWTYSIGGKTSTIEARLTGIAGGKITIERKSDGKKGTMDLQLFSGEDREYVSSIARQ